MGLTFAQLKSGPVNFPPVPVPVSGFCEPILIHQFSINQMKNILSADKENPDVDEEYRVRNQLLKFLNGYEYEPTEEDRLALLDIFSSGQIHEVYSKALKLNGKGPDALREAEKN